MRIGIAADHGGFELKELLTKTLCDLGYEVMDYGASGLNPEDDYPDFVVPLAKAVSDGKVDRAMAICGSGVGACVVANKVADVRVSLIHETFSAHQGVEDDDIKTFLQAKFSGAERFQRRLAKVGALENKEAKS